MYLKVRERGEEKKNNLIVCGVEKIISSWAGAGAKCKKRDVDDGISNDIDALCFN